jgi:hypothetical protein
MMSLAFHFRFRLFNDATTFVATVVAGTLGAGFALARLYSRSTRQLVLRGILFSMGILFFYGVAAYAGCLLIVSNMH